VDSEAPVFTNCPPKTIYVASDVNGQLVPVTYDVPVAVDNSGAISWTRVEPTDFAPPRFITRVR